ncbi:hypothetical protein EIJ82_01525 [Alkalihalobacillus clausii]|nr:hypothetical protein [Shouchella clausii]
MKLDYAAPAAKGGRTVEIKVRGYATLDMAIDEEMAGGRWVVGTGISTSEFADKVAQEIGRTHECFIYTDRGWVEVDQESLGVFTGLRDIEQFDEPKELYTGDVVRMHQFLFDGTEHENEIIGVLVYDKELACVCLTEIQHKTLQEYMGYKDDQEGFEKEKVPICNFYGLHECSWTYLGNKFENPELLNN